MQDPANTDWQQNLAAAHNRIGDVAQARGDLSAAEQAFTKYLAISNRLTAQDPVHASWQRDLAAAHRRMGDVAQARDDLSAAEQAFTQYLAISESTDRARSRQHRLATGPGRYTHRSAAWHKLRRPCGGGAGVHTVPGHLRAAERAGSRQYRLAAGAGGGVQPDRRCGASSRRPCGGGAGVHPVAGYLRAAERAGSRQHRLAAGAGGRVQLDRRRGAARGDLAGRSRRSHSRWPSPSG